MELEFNLKIQQLTQPPSTELELALLLNYNQLRSTKSQFNVSQSELQEIRSELSLKLDNLQDEFGHQLDKKPEPKRPQTRWDYVIREMQEYQEYLMQRRSFFKNKCKKLAEQALIKRDKYKEVQREKKMNQIRSIQRQSEQLGKMVEREFWRNCQKVLLQIDLAQTQRQQKKSQEEKLDTFVNKLNEVTEQLAVKLEQYGKNYEQQSKEIQLKSIDVEKYKQLYQDFQVGLKLQHQRKMNQISKKKSNIIQIPKYNDKLEFVISLQRLSDNKFNVIETFEREKDSNLKQSQDMQDESDVPCLDADNCLTLIKQSYQFKDIFSRREDEKAIQLKQPYLLKGVLRNYQLVGMQWMISLQQKGMNGILADEMGLGKTIQTIAMLAYLAANYGVWGPHLVIVPTSILVNWEIEFKRWCPAFKIMTYFGSPKERKLKRTGWSQPNFFHVCITSYKLVIQDNKIFRRKRWQYLILDEAQHIKNFRSQRWQVLLNFNTRYRLLLTGTPLQNDLGEVWSLLHFLMPVVFDNHQEFLDWFGGPIEKALQENSEVHAGLLSKLHTILRPFVLRRLKKDVEKQLPEKKEVIIKCQLSRRQKYLYDEFISNSGNFKINSTDFVSVMNVVQQLRKVCNHPELFEQRPVASPYKMQNLTLTLPYRVIYIVKSWNFQSDSDIAVHQRQNQLFPDQQKIETQLLNSKIISNSSRLGLRWVQSQKQEESETLLNNTQIMFKRLVLSHAMTNVYWLKLNFLDKLYDTVGYLIYAVMPTIEILLDRMFTQLQEFTFVQAKVVAMTPTLWFRPYSSQFRLESDTLEEEMQYHICPIVDALSVMLQRQRLVFPNKKFLIYDCGKLNQMLRLVQQLKQEGHKIIIFTQMTKMLDIIEAVLSMSKISYLRLDGSTGVELRQRQVERFNQDSRVTCFISSTRSGGIGINLTGADTVIFYDTDWNPAMDKQAQDRCHRIGQTRAVTIYRLISSSTIEENILLKSMQKRQLNTWVMECGFFSTDQLITNHASKLLMDEDVTFTNDDFERALEKVEDKEDAMAAKQAAQEEKNHQNNGFEEILQMNQQDEILDWLQPNLFPPIVKYGLKMLDLIRSDHSTHSYRIEAEVIEDQDELIQEEEQSISDEEDEQDQNQLNGNDVEEEQKEVDEENNDMDDEIEDIDEQEQQQQTPSPKRPIIEPRKLRNRDNLNINHNKDKINIMFNNITDNGKKRENRNRIKN